MKIETKFDVGQEVWLVGWELLGISSYRVRRIITSTDKCGGQSICYYNTMGETADESDLFPTRAAALAEIERRKAK
jgi:hypothetical protein